jgi:hypothetical protein
MNVTMRRSSSLRLTLSLSALLLSGCGLADSHSTFVPQPFRAPEPQQLQAETPDVRALVLADPNGLFLSSASPRNIRISPAQPSIPGLSWTACVKADVTGMSGNIISDQILQIEIAAGKIRDRRRADAKSPCIHATYEPL